MHKPLFTEPQTQSLSVPDHFPNSDQHLAWRIFVYCFFAEVWEEKPLILKTVLRAQPISGSGRLASGDGRWRPSLRIYTNGANASPSLLNSRPLDKYSTVPLAHAGSPSPFPSHSSPEIIVTHPHRAQVIASLRIQSLHGCRAITLSRSRTGMRIMDHESWN